MQSEWVNTGTLREQLQALQLSPKHKKRYRANVARRVKRKVRKNIKAQAGINGQFAKRKRKRTLRGKMLSGFGRDKNLHVKNRGDGVSIGYIGGVARQHQEGARITVNNRPMSAQRLEQMKQLQAIPSQARLLIRLGFTMPGRKRKKGRKKRVSQKWIRENMTQHGAMIWITALRSDNTSNSAELPARPFFPNDEQWVVAMAQDELRKTLRSR